MTRLPSNGIKKNIDNILPSIMTRIPSIGVTKISSIDYLP